MAISKTNKRGLIIVVVFFAVFILLSVSSVVLSLNLSSAKPKQALKEFVYSNEEFIEEYGEDFKFRIVSYNITTYSSETKSGYAEFTIKIEKTRYYFELVKEDDEWEILRYEKL